MILPIFFAKFCEKLAVSGIKLRKNFNKNFEKKTQKNAAKILKKFRKNRKKFGKNSVKMRKKYEPGVAETRPKFEKSKKKIENFRKKLISRTQIELGKIRPANFVYYFSIEHAVRIVLLNEKIEIFFPDSSTRRFYWQAVEP